MFTQILNGNILTPQGWLKGGSIIIDGEKIVEINDSTHLLPDTTVFDATGLFVIPGGIDMHVHGGGGADFMEGSSEAFRTAVHTHLRHVTTSIFPTLAASSASMIRKAAATCENLMKVPQSTIMGLHLEGPYLNPAKAGGQIPEYIKEPDYDEYSSIISDFPCIRRWDVSPELDGALSMGCYLFKHNILAAIAHTDADYDLVRTSYSSGFTHATHFYNAMTSVHNVREFKHEGTIEAIYLIDGISVEVIADGIHVPAPILRLIHKIKGAEHTALVTDSMAVTDAPASHAFDARVIIEDGVCKLADRSALAGSIATMDRLIRTCVKQAEIPLEDASCMASATPAKIMGIYDRKGSIERGKDADIIMFDRDINLKAVFSLGNKIDINS